MATVDEIVLAASPGEIRLALLAAGRVVGFVVDRGDAAPGDVIAGRVVEIAHGPGAAFVEIGEALPGYLAKHAGLGEGQSVLVEVTVTARRGKGAELKRASAAAIPVRRPALVRALAENPNVTRVTVDHPAALAGARRIFATAEHRADCFVASGAADALEEALASRVTLDGGGALHFAETEAATLIDIDGGGRAPAAVNQAAIPEIARHLRLRELAGHVLVDIIPTRDGRAPARLVAVLRAAVADDPAPAQVIGRTPLGMIELTRRRRGPSLAEAMLEYPAPTLNAVSVALDGLRALLRESAARPAAKLTLLVAPRIATALRARPAALAEAGRRLGRPVVLVERAGIELFAVEEQVR